MKLAVIGSRGQLGSELLRLWGERAAGLSHADVEIRDADSIATALDAIGPDVVVNTAAYNAVDRAEEDPSEAFGINAIGPLNLARYCSAQGTTLLHVSTDYVFGAEAGRSMPYTEHDRPGPLSVYGTSKLAGEYLTAQACANHFIVRTCGLYGTADDESKGNFVRTMLRLAEERDELRIVDDQHCTPTSTSDLARAIDALVNTRAYGLYHITNRGQTTWCALAQAVFEIMSRDIRVVPISSAEFAATARRPPYSVLDCGRFTAATGQKLRSWRVALEEYLTGLTK